MFTKKCQKMPKLFICENCNFTCSKESNYKQHLLTRKHTNVDKMLTKYDEKMPKNAENYYCECGKIYKYRQSLSVHKKKCVKKNENNNVIFDNEIYIDDQNIIKKKQHEIVELKSIVKNLMKQNNQLVKTISEITPKIGNTKITNNTNNHFNLHFFLNEQCKDAININEFVNSLEITIDDLNYTKDNGLMKGITDVMIRGLKELDIHKRPIHCTDTKRETLYIKDENKWEKDENNEKLKETIVTMANKERDAINAWKEEYPLWNENEEVQDEFILLVNKVYTPIEEQEHYEKKIIKALTKEVSIEK